MRSNNNLERGHKTYESLKNNKTGSLQGIILEFFKYGAQKYDVRMINGEDLIQEKAQTYITSICKMGDSNSSKNYV